MNNKKNTIITGREGISVNLVVEINEEKGIYVAYCPALDLATQGDSIDEAKQNFSDILDTFFEELVNRGTLEKVLLTLGWTMKLKPKVILRPPSRVLHAGRRGHDVPMETFNQEVAVPLAYQG